MSFVFSCMSSALYVNLWRKRLYLLRIIRQFLALSLIIFCIFILATILSLYIYISLILSLSLSISHSLTHALYFFLTIWALQTTELASKILLVHVVENLLSSNFAMGGEESLRLPPPSFFPYLEISILYVQKSPVFWKDNGSEWKREKETGEG